MKAASATTPRWVVSTRTRGEVLVAGASSPVLELVLVGLPAQLARGEAEGWLRDLASVADETARADARERALPALLYHALTGLLFTQGELWATARTQPPCAIAFVETPLGAAFGWVGDIRAHVAVDGQPHEPRWVLVRDEEGREARGVLLPDHSHVQVILEYGEPATRGGEAPVEVDAEWSKVGHERTAPMVTETPMPNVRTPEAPAEPAAAPHAVPAPPVAIAPPPAEPAATDEAIVDDASESNDADEPNDGADELSDEQALALESLTAPRSPHPVARWLGKLVSFASPWPRAPRPGERVRENVRPDDPAPVSSYDALLSESVPPTPEPETLEFEAEATPEPAPEPAPAPIVSEAPAIAPPPVAPAPPPALALASPPAPAMESPRERLVRAMNDAKAEELPKLEVPLAKAPSDAPLSVDHEPVGADESFAIPLAPARAGKPAEPRPAAKPEGAPPVAPAPRTPRVLKVQAGEPAKAPVLHVPVAGATTSAAPPVLKVSPSQLPPAPMDLEPLDGILTAYAPKGPGLAARPRRWPTPEPPKRKLQVSRGTWIFVGIILAVFAAGWILGILATPRTADEPGPMVQAMRAIGLGGAHFTAEVSSNPPGAWIAVDGKDAARRTPAKLELTPGPHTITFSMPDLGSASEVVRGRKGQDVVVNPTLDGSLDIQSTDDDVPITVKLDGKPLGYAPVHVDALPPGLHEVQFSGPGLPAWAQQVQVGIRREELLVARPMSAPANGVIQVAATLNDESGSAPLSGAQVWVDGELRGTTPASLDLPRGPHSLRLTYRGETAPVQVIDLPGGNRRFASFSFGLEDGAPEVTQLSGVHPASLKQTVAVTAALTNLRVRDIREAWLHVKTPDGLWRRYEMAPGRGPKGPIVAAVFPPAAFDARGTSKWYVSVSTLQGDEAFSEMQTATVGGAPKRPSTPATATTPVREESNPADTTR